MKNIKSNFYFNILNSQEESVEVYVGQGSGKQLNIDIQNAQKEVLIISPYIDETKLDELITLRNSGIDVRIAFSDLHKKQRSNILRKLILQNTYVDRSKTEKQRDKKKNQNRVSYSVLFIGFFLLLYCKEIIIGAAAIYLFYYLNKKNSSDLESEWIEYEYTKMLDFKYLKNDYWSKDKMFIHSKIYIIDRKIAYMGSMNFTKNGFNSNFETRIRITHSKKIEDLVEFVLEILSGNNRYKEHELNELGDEAFM